MYTCVCARACVCVRIPYLGACACVRMFLYTCVLVYVMGHLSEGVLHFLTNKCISIHTYIIYIYIRILIHTYIIYIYIYTHIINTYICVYMYVYIYFIGHLSEDVLHFLTIKFIYMYIRILYIYIYTGICNYICIFPGTFV